MRISFDLDDTLICYGGGVPCEPNRVPRLLPPWFNEPLRAGTVGLMQELQRRGWRIAIYTTSNRSPRQLRWWFRFQGIRISVVVNHSLHQLVVRGMPTKLPSRFGIDLHVDDSEGVAEEGQEYGFAVVVVKPEDAAWASKVLETTSRLEAVIRRK
jgi:hypothetical protein